MSTATIGAFKAPPLSFPTDVPQSVEAETEVVRFEAVQETEKSGSPPSGTTSMIYNENGYQPTGLSLGTLGHPEVRVLRPFDIAIEYNKDSVAVSWRDEFGAGATFTDALIDFQQTMTELFITLETTENLGPDLVSLHTVLKEFLSYSPMKEAA